MSDNAAGGETRSTDEMLRHIDVRRGRALEADLERELVGAAETRANEGQTGVLEVRLDRTAAQGVLDTSAEGLRNRAL